MAVETAASPAVRVRRRLKGDKAELSWLMRTTYISNDGDKQASGTVLASGLQPDHSNTPCRTRSSCNACCGLDLHQ